MNNDIINASPEAIDGKRSKKRTTKLRSKSKRRI